MNDFENFKNWIEMGDEVEFTYKAEDFMNNAKIENELLKNIWDKVVDISVF